MKTKIPILFLLFLGIISASYSQEFAIDRRAKILSFNASFSTNGDIFFDNSEDDNLNSITLITDYKKFCRKGFYIGGIFQYSYLAVKRPDNNFELGPQFGVAFGKKESSVYPYLGAGGLLAYFGARRYSNKIGFDILLTTGLMIPLKDHIGVNIGLNLNTLFYENEKMYDYLSLNVGISGLLY